MPQIKQYTSRTDIAAPFAGRRASGEDFAGGLTGVGDVSTEIARSAHVVNQRQEQLEVTDLHAKAADLQAQSLMDLQTELSKADPNDRSFTENYIAKIDEKLGQWADGASTVAGRNYAVRAGAELRSHLITKAFAGQAALGAEKAKTDWTTSLNKFSSVLQNDPSSFDTVMSMHAEGIDGLVAAGLLPRQKAMELKQKGEADLAESAVRGWINVDPAGAKERLKSGQFAEFLKGDQIKQLDGEANVAINAARIEGERQKKAAHEELKTKQMETQNDFLQRLTAGKLTAKDILASNLDPFGSGSKEQFLQLLDHKNKEGGSIKTDPGTFQRLFNDIHAGKITNENDLNAYLGKGVNFEDLNRLRGEVQGRRTSDGKFEADLTQAFFKSARNQITRTNELTGMRDPIGDELFYNFQVQAMTEYARQRKEGKSALDLLDPNSKDYVGRGMERFRRSPEQIIRDLAAQTGGGSKKPVADDPKARKPGESVADYLARTKN